VNGALATFFARSNSYGVIVDGFRSIECVEVPTGDDVGVNNFAYLARGVKQAML